MKKNNKKGFTIVELVIVIAVIAILAAVLIPTFSSVIKKAKVNNDIQLVRNLNTALAADNKEHATMQSALDAAFEFGYDVAKINDTSVDENKILWDSKNDVFCYLKDGTLEYVPNSVADGDKLSADSYLLWNISKTVDTTFSTYLYNYEVTETTKKVIALKGLDVGKTEGITEIEYENTTGTAQEVVIRTNGGKLTINAIKDIIHHYDYASTADIKAVDLEHSYHEHGTVGFTQIAYGHYVAEATANVNTLLATGKNTEVKIDKKGGSIENAYTTDESSKETQHGGNESLEYYTGNVEELEIAATMFAGGDGTKNNPYLIANGNQWYNLLTIYQGDYMGSSTSGLYVKLIGNVDMTGYDISTYCSYPRNFHLDGNNFTMSNFTTSIWGGEGGTLYLNNEFVNLKLKNCSSADSGDALFSGTQNSNTASVVFRNVDLENCSAVGGAYQYYDGSATATFIDCDAVNTNVTGGYMASGGFIGNISTGKIIIDHCSFGGSVVSTQSACAGFVGQSPNYDVSKITIKDSTIVAGTVIRNVAGGSVAAFNAHTGSQDYAQFNNTFYGTLESSGTMNKQGTNAATKTYVPVCTADDFSFNSETGEITYSGDAGLGKIAVQVYINDDYLYYGNYYGGYNWYVCDPIKAENVVKGTKISGVPILKDFYNVVSSNDVKLGLKTTSQEYLDEIHDGVFYFDALDYSWGHYMLSGTYNSKTDEAIEPTSLRVYIQITVYDMSGALSGTIAGAHLSYDVDLSNHGNNN